MDSFNQGNNKETSSDQEIDQPEKLVNDDNAGTGRSYECNFCKRGFTNAQALGGHMNIHRKDKAKLAKSKQVPAESSIPNKLNNYFPPFMSDQNSSYPGLGANMSYRRFVGTQNPSLLNANLEDSSRVDANLSLGIGRPYVEENEEKKIEEKIDTYMGDDDDVDLELRLGHKTHNP